MPNGVITIDVVESLDSYREQLRVALGEQYRTMLGHFRHEVGHYYQNILVENGPGADRYLADCRKLFGDEQISYSDEIAAALQVRRHPRAGTRRSSPSTRRCTRGRISPRCFAHYLHITDTIDTTREAGMVLHADLVRFSAPRDVAPLECYDEAPIERLLYDWKWISMFFNRVNTAMGKRPLYPFEIPRPVIDKLGFVHRVVAGDRQRTGELRSTVADSVNRVERGGGPSTR